MSVIECNRALKKPIKLQNLSSGHVSVDTLHHNSIEKVPCSNWTCSGSLMKPKTVCSKSHRLKDEVLLSAEHFFNQYFASIKRLNSSIHEKRLAQVREQIERTGTYHLLETELIFGAKLAWRNASRCIGRIQWSKLQVFDARYVTSAKEMFDAACNHIKYSTNKGNLRSAITIFPQRTPDEGDFRIWNSQLISYAGYADPNNPGHFIGDPINFEFTQLCMRLGWQPKEKTPFDILPLIVSAAGQDPQCFVIPEELILRVPLEHPKYKWFDELKLQWYAVPAVSNMLLDIGGVEFPACPFNGWYMVTEIACRDLCDVNRYNILEKVALKLGLDTRSNMTLWRDEALVVVSKAVLDSFHKRGVTIVDHHTAAESFMKHLENEQRLRGGCPADWVWIVPPTGGSLTPVFHQEMVNYCLKPSFEYQEPAWKSHRWHSSPDSVKSVAQARKKRFKEIARAVKFTSNLFGKALAKRIKATILFATETGRSEEYAKRLEQIFSYAFNVTIMCMDSYDTFQLEHEALLLIVTSTFGNGDPPENGESFARQLQAIKVTGDTTPDLESVKNVSTSFLRVQASDLNENDGKLSSNTIISHIGPLSNIRFAVFGLGSSAYPNFCAFGKYIDTILGELGGERINKLGTGDELCGQEQSFNSWSKDVFERACEVFCISDEMNLNDVMKTAVLKPKSWSIQNCKLVPLPGKVKKPMDFVRALSKCSNRKVIPFGLVDSIPLHKGGENERQTIRIILQQDDCGHDLSAHGILDYKPGDHLGIFPENSPLLVQCIMKRLSYLDFQTVYQVNIQRLTDDNSDEIEYVPHEKLPSCSIEEALIRYLDITTPPTQRLLSVLSTFCINQQQRNQMQLLANDTEKFEEWKAYKYPNFYEVLMEFDSLKPPAEVVLTQLPILQPRFYSISSSDTYYSWLNKPTLNGNSNIDNHNNQTIQIPLSASPSHKSSSSSFLSSSSPSSVSNSPSKSRVNASILSTLSPFDPISWITAGINSKTGKRSDKLKCNNNNRHNNNGNNSTLTKPYINGRHSLGIIPSGKMDKENTLRTQHLYSVRGATKVDLTVAIVRYQTSSGSQHFGVCSNFLADIQCGHKVYGFLRSAPNFRMPNDYSVPIIMVGPGTGIAPFRAFWLQRYATSLFNPLIKNRFGPMSLYFGCRTPSMELYCEETREMLQENILTKIRIAYSRVPNKPKEYVQDLLRKYASTVYNQIIHENGHFYVCGDVSMAEGVCQTLRNILQDHGSDDPEKVLMSLRKENRYHEDIFGITLRTDEVRRKGRSEALTRKSMSTST